MITIDEERKKLIQSRIHDFFLENHDLDLGLIGQDEIYDFFLEELGGEIYNSALDDAFKFIKRQQDNMESDFYVLYKNR